MPRRSTNNDDADSGTAEAGAEEEQRSLAAAISPPPPAATSSDAAITTSSPTTAAPPAAGVELSPSSDDAPVPLAQTLAASDEAEMDSKKKGVEVIDSSGGDVPVPVAMMDTSYDLDEAEKGAAGTKMAGKSVELADDDDDVGPVPPGHAVDDGTDSKIAAKKLKAGRVRGLAPGIAAGDDDSVCEPVLEEDPAQNLVTASAPRGGRFPSGDAGGPNARNRQREVPRPSPAEPSVPVFHEVHARLVEDEPEQPVYDAVPVGEEHWAKRHQKKIIGGFVLVIVAMAVALGVAFGTGGGEDDAATVIFATSPPTRSLSPSSQPSMYPRPCFADREELKAAVDDYTEGGAACMRGASECEVVQKYGWPIGSWCTSNVTDMSELFYEKFNFDDDLSSWDTSSVTTMRSMFMSASSFNGDVSNFDTSQVTTMERMFDYASSFNGDVSSFDTAQVTDMMLMFQGARSFNGNVSSFNTSQVTSMRRMFYYASSFNGDVSNFDSSQVTSMGEMFYEASSFNQDVSGWDVAAVTSMTWMFSYASSFNQNLCAWGSHYNATGVSYGNMFMGTNCTNQGSPQGPNTNWCAACSPTPSPTTGPSGEPTTSPRPTPSPTTMADCIAAGKQTFQVDVLTDDYPTETAYTLVNLCTGLTEASLTTPYTLEKTSYTDIHCVSDAEFTFTIYDYGDDGLCCSYGDGGYSATYGGSVVASGGDFGSSENTTFGTCVFGA